MALAVSLPLCVLLVVTIAGLAGRHGVVATETRAEHLYGPAGSLAEAIVALDDEARLSNWVLASTDAPAQQLTVARTTTDRAITGVRGQLGQLQKARATTAVEQGATEVLKNLVGTLAEVGGIILDIVLALVISLYLLIDGPRFRARSLALVPAEHRAKALFLEDNVSRVLGGYLRGQLTLAVIIGVAAGAGTALLGLPYAVVLGVLAGLFELVPMFGPILSVVPAVLVALFLPFPTVLWVVLFFLAVQQIENNILSPRISGHAVGLHPLGAMFALLAGFQLAGLLGGLFAVPLAGVLWVLLGAAYRNAVAATPQVRRWSLPRWRRGLAVRTSDAAESTRGGEARR